MYNSDTFFITDFFKIVMLLLLTSDNADQDASQNQLWLFYMGHKLIYESEKLEREKNNRRRKTTCNNNLSTNYCNLKRKQENNKRKEIKIQWNRDFIFKLERKWRSIRNVILSDHRKDIEDLIEAWYFLIIGKKMKMISRIL